jgi:hypothetical protein
MMLLLDPTLLARGLVRKTVDVVNYPDGRFAVQFEGVALSFRKFDKIQTVEPPLGDENRSSPAGVAVRIGLPRPYRTARAATRSPDRRRPCG